jgi:hypothetical protein
MPTLSEDLKKVATDIIVVLNGANPPFTRDQLRQLPWDAVGLKVSVASFFQRGAQYLSSFADKIEKHKPDLYPWVTVYGAALGAQAVFNRVLYIWVESATDPQQVTDAIDKLFPAYAAWIKK